MSFWIRQGPIVMASNKMIRGPAKADKKIGSRLTHTEQAIGEGNFSHVNI